MTEKLEGNQRPLQMLFNNWNKQMAKHCLCTDCCNVRTECNRFLMSLPIDVSITLDLTNHLTKCPNGSSYLERNSEFVKEMEVQTQAISGLCKSITEMIEKPLEKFR